jgi:hypothetical protein
MLEQVPRVGLQGAPVLAQHGVHQLVDRVGLHVGEDLLDRDDQRGLADDPPLPVDHGGQLAHGLDGVAGVRFGQQLLAFLVPFRLHLGPELGDDRLDVQVRVPDVHEGSGPRTRASRCGSLPPPPE